MTKWEYMTLRAYRDEVMKINGADTGIGGKKRPKYPDYLNVLGREGWEVTAYVPDGLDPQGISAFEVLLRRPLP